MNELSENNGFDDSFDLPSTNGLDQQSQAVYNGSVDGTLNLFNRDSEVNKDTMRLLFITIAIIIVLVCITISTILFICICLNRRRSFKRQERQDHLLLPEQSEKISDKKKSLIKPSRKNKNNPTATSHNTQLPGKTNPPLASNMSHEKIQMGPYFENLDDIPYIDDSRPTSFIEIPRV